MNFRRHLPSNSELLRFLSRMAASEPTSYLSKDDDFLEPLSYDLETLIDDLGCFPFAPGT